MSANEQIMIPASELVHEYVRLAKIEELEKLKAEILSNWFIKKDDYYSNLVVNSILLRIDEHISKLKGENNV